MAQVVNASSEIIPNTPENTKKFIWYTRDVGVNWDGNIAAFIARKIVNIIPIIFAFIADLARGLLYCVGLNDGQAKYLQSPQRAAVPEISVVPSENHDEIILNVSEEEMADAAESEALLDKATAEKKAKEAKKEFLPLVMLAFCKMEDPVGISDFILNKFLPQNIESLELPHSDDPSKIPFILTLTEAVTAKISIVEEGGNTKLKGVTFSSPKIITGFADTENGRMIFDKNIMKASKLIFRDYLKSIEGRENGSVVLGLQITTTVSSDLKELEASCRHLVWEKQ